jgi:signal transduction histidine kinase
MTNALRHGHPRHLTIELDYQLDSIFLRVSDDGRGFDTSDGLREQTGHWGVISMRERAAAIGGSFTIASRLGSGTQVETVVPLSAES